MSRALWNLQPSRQLTLLSCSGGSDAVFRYGGDEFLIILADTLLLREEIVPETLGVEGHLHRACSSGNVAANCWVSPRPVFATLAWPFPCAKGRGLVA
jgi:hypothetical protein